MSAFLYSIALFAVGFGLRFALSFFGAESIFDGLSFGVLCAILADKLDERLNPASGEKTA